MMITEVILGNLHAIEDIVTTLGLIAFHADDSN
jgi:hypothetical protein